MHAFITLPLEFDQDFSAVEIIEPVNFKEFKRVEKEHSERARSYHQAAVKTLAPKTAPISVNRLKNEQKRYAARAAAYAKAVSKTKQLLVSDRPSTKPKPLVVKGCAKPRRAVAHRSTRAHNTRPIQASASSAGSSESPRPRTRSKFRVYIGSMRFDTMHAAMSDAAIENAKRMFPGCEILHRQMFSNTDQFPAKLTNIDVAIFIPYRSPFGRDHHKQLERGAILAGNPNALILTAEADGTFAATRLKPKALKSRDVIIEENCKKALIYFVNGRTEAEAACFGGLSPWEFKKFLSSLPDYARAGQVRLMAVYTGPGKRVEAYFAGQDLATATGYMQLIGEINRGEAGPSELGRFEGKQLQALKSGKSRFIKNKIIKLCSDFSRIREDRECPAVYSSLKHHPEESRYLHYRDCE